MNIVKPIFETQLSIMKRCLKMGEFKFGKSSDEFKYFKEETMNIFYEGTRKLFNQFVADGIFERCDCGANMRHGWTNCEHCSGSGFKDKTK